MATLVAGMSGDLAMKTMSDILRAMHQVSPLNPSLKKGTWQNTRCINTVETVGWSKWWRWACEYGVRVALVGTYPARIASLSYYGVNSDSAGEDRYTGMPIEMILFRDRNSRDANGFCHSGLPFAIT